MLWPFVSRKHFQFVTGNMVRTIIELEDKVAELEKERDGYIGAACELASIAREDHKQELEKERAALETERNHFEAILTNMKEGRR